MSLVQPIPCLHKTRQDLGRGLIVGDHQIVKTIEDEKGNPSVIQECKMLVIFENADKNFPCPSIVDRKDLVHAINFDSYFDDEDDEDDDDEVLDHEEDQEIPENEDDEN